ncbi:hypothetical protein [Nocardioides sp. NPDC004968]|uniref:hypothetical protein n=1 Tax=Nocardioides sp. NPDC004968 TaxID=3155894 RepID=UPI0033B0656C
MKEQYVGDVNDYRKYALLRLLSRSGLKLGVCWMLTPNDGRSDGNKLGYLDQAKQERHDPELFTLLRRVRNEPDARRLLLIEANETLPGAGRLWRNLAASRRVHAHPCCLSPNRSIRSGA